MRNAIGLTERDMLAIKNILSKYPDIQEVKIFGSRAKGVHRLFSDIDLAITQGTPDVQQIAALKADFEESSLPYKVDVLIFERADTHVQEHINRVGQQIYP
ncbi:MAG: nucleotidyltransferase domain-containing protein [Chitinophagales bacterium]|nr:nucleotidyltransferase domain-containing protein [Chitinophagales bacterium]